MIPLPFSPGLSAIVPSWHQLAGAGGLFMALAVCLLLGALATGRDSEPETQIIGGWGAVCIALTLWGVATPASLRIPLFAMAVLAASVLLLPGLRQRIAPMRGTGKVLVLAIPLWLVMLPAVPSQVDTWLNLLPNAAYLADHAHFPAAGAPPSFSFLPGAPYDTQFIAFAASAFIGSFAQNAMGLFNVALACAAGMVLARQLPGWGGRGWAAWAGAAMGLLLAVPLNPGFVPRYCFAPYGEWPLAVTTMLGGLAGLRLVEAKRPGAVAAHALALTLVLAAQVNTKQSGLGLVLAVGLSVLVVGCGWGTMRGARRLWLVAPMLPAIALYWLWQGYVARSGATQLVVTPMADWNTWLLPQILFAMAHEAIKHFALFIAIFGVLAGAWRALRTRRDDEAARLLLITAGTVVLYNGYLLASYVVHSDPGDARNAHSYFRYNTQLSLLVMLALTVWLRPVVLGWIGRASALARRRLQLGAVALVLIAPVALWPLLRFDLDAPQPTLAALAKGVENRMQPGDRLAMVLPGDTDDALGSFLRGHILFTRPRMAVPAFVTYPQFQPGTLAEATKAGFDKLLLTCAPASITGTAEPAAALMGRDGGSWHLLAAWSYPARLRHEHFDSLIPRQGLCGG